MVKNFVDDIGVLFVEISVKNDINVDIVFNIMVEEFNEKLVSGLFLMVIFFKNLVKSLGLNDN